MLKRQTSARILAATTALAVGGLFAAGPAQAKDGDVIATGQCSGNSDWKLKLGPRDAVIETDFEVDSNVVGQTWSVKITDNGTTVFRGTATTVAPSGSFTVDIRPADQAGTDNFTATARNRDTGERCVASAAV